MIDDKVEITAIILLPLDASCLSKQRARTPDVDETYRHKLAPKRMAIVARNLRQFVYERWFISNV